MAKVTLICRGQRQTFSLRDGLGLQALAAQHPEAPLEFDCREADCGICLVKVLAGADRLAPPGERERDFLKAMHAAPGERLGCQCRVLGDCELEIPPP